jgi:hypothetical protein
MLRNSSDYDDNFLEFGNKNIEDSTIKGIEESWIGEE